jgi:hypothetical protein
VSIKTAIYAALKDAGPAFPVVAPQGTAAPYLRYVGIGGSDDVTFDADGLGATSGLVQVDAFALDYATAQRLLESARAALYASPAVTIGDLTYLPDDYEGDTKLFKASFQVEAWE